MFTLGIEKTEKGVVGNTVIVMGVVTKFSMKSPLLKILGDTTAQISCCSF